MSPRAVSALPERATRLPERATRGGGYRSAELALPRRSRNSTSAPTASTAASAIAIQTQAGGPPLSEAGWACPAGVPLEVAVELGVAGAVRVNETVPVTSSPSS